MSLIPASQKLWRTTFLRSGLDKFAHIGPTLISPEVFADNTSAYVLTRVNGETRQKADLQKDMIFSPDIVLSHMSEGGIILKISVTVRERCLFVWQEPRFQRARQS